jgi:hypothetical protein
MGGRALSIDRQRAAMAAAWPMFACRDIDRGAQSARWVGTLVPQFARFTLETRYRLGDWPEVRVLHPELVRLPENVEGELPHVFPPADDPTLCLFDPKADEWDASMAIAHTVVPWALDWIACYELWLMTGRWTGGGRHATVDNEQAAA